MKEHITTITRQKSETIELDVLQELQNMYTPDQIAELKNDFCIAYNILSFLDPVTAIIASFVLVNSLLITEGLFSVYQPETPILTGVMGATVAIMPVVACASTYIYNRAEMFAQNYAERRLVKSVKNK